MADTRKLPTYLFALLALCVLLGGVYALNEISIYTPDSTRYLVWARSLAAGAGYLDASSPEPARYVVHAPLYSALLAPAALAFPGSILAAKILTLCLGILMLWLAYRWYAGAAGEAYAFIGCILLAANPLYFLYSGEVLSDVPFAAAIILSWMLTERVCASDRFRPGMALALAASVAAALLLREIGASVCFSTVVYLGYRRRWKDAAVVFLIPALIYAAWYVRNEILVAPMENPPLTNAKILTYHFLTPASSSLLQEFAARFGNNLGVYAKQIGDLVFAPLYFSMQYDVIPSSHPVLQVVLATLNVVRYPLAFLALASTIYGLWIDGRTSPSASLRIVFLGAYAAIALSYPINDIRFLLPLLVLSVYYCLVGWQSFRPSWSTAAVIVTVSVFMLPNVCWDGLYAQTSARFTRAPADFAAGAEPPTHFTKPFRPVGEWLAAHSDSSAVIMAQWKDLALWAGGRKVLNVDQTLSLDEFENQLRDYRVSILVSQVKRSGITEFAIPMHQSRMYAFDRLARIGNTDVYRVTAQKAPVMHTIETPFDEGLASLESGNYAAAESVMALLWRRNPQNITALYVLATATGAAGNAGRADSLFTLLRSFPQAGIYLARASQHQQLLQALAQAAKADAGPMRAELLAGAAAGYWNAGWRFRARQLVDAALREDSTCAPAVTFGFHFALKAGDLAAAEQMSAKFTRMAPQSPISGLMGTMLAARARLDSATAPELRAASCDSLAESYATLGLTEDAISYALEGHTLRPEDAHLTVMLADLYAAKRRYFLAREVLQSFDAAHPGSDAVRTRLASLPQPL